LVKFGAAATSIDDWRRVMALNLDAAFLSLKYGVRAIREGRGATIVVAGSALGVKAAPGASAYCASKAAVRMLLKTAALELKAEGIRVNCVSPAGVVTPMWRGMPFWNDLVRQHGTEEAAWNALGGADPTKTVHSAHGISGGDFRCECVSELRTVRASRGRIWRWVAGLRRSEVRHFAHAAANTTSASRKLPYGPSKHRSIPCKLRL
jgi:NAD(P)-dependent dehydrogenase (short-subunit alcohol dehydrogenase family)